MMIYLCYDSLKSSFTFDVLIGLYAPAVFWIVQFVREMGALNDPIECDGVSKNVNNLTSLKG